MSTLTASLEFDHVYRLTAHDDAPTLAGSDYLPTVEHDDTHDILLDGIPRADCAPDDWQPLTGITGQYGYRGAVMHASELFSPAHVAALASLCDDDTPTHDDMPDDGTPSIVVSAVEFALVAVECDDDDNPGAWSDTPAGWSVIYRPIFYRAHTWSRARFTGARTCQTCHTMPLDDDDTATACPGYFGGRS